VETFRNITVLYVSSPPIFINGDILKYQVDCGPGNLFPHQEGVNAQR
jgi:hypothetical protein